MGSFDWSERASQLVCLACLVQCKGRVTSGDPCRAPAPPSGLSAATLQLGSSMPPITEQLKLILQCDAAPRRPPVCHDAPCMGTVIKRMPVQRSLMFASQRHSIAARCSISRTHLTLIPPACGLVRLEPLQITSAYAWEQICHLQHSTYAGLAGWHGRTRSWGRSFSCEC